MPGFRDYLKSDLDVLFNLEEFATINNVNGIDMAIIIDNDLLKEREQRDQGSYDDPSGIYQADVLFHVKKSEFGEKPVYGQRLELDGELYYVTGVEEDESIYSITLGAYQS